jgi:[ribosomal protein S18]-alanine N-acetyltransferase
MTTVRIAAAGPADIPAVMEVMRVSFDPAYGESWSATQCDAMLALPGTAMHIAWTDKSPAGFTMSRVIAGEAELLLIAVKPDKQLNGVGRFLLDYVRESVALLGAKSMFLEVRAGNSAIQLYKSVGFVQIGFRQGYYKGLDGQFFDAETFRLDFS